ncbi:hypothetical protein KI387_043401, partial [Taxus chinensis]
MSKVNWHKERMVHQIFDNRGILSLQESFIGIKEEKTKYDYVQGKKERWAAQEGVLDEGGQDSIQAKIVKFVQDQTFSSNISLSGVSTGTLIKGMNRDQEKTKVLTKQKTSSSVLGKGGPNQ